MSSGPAYVRFPDGLIARTTYHGTSDVLHDELHPWGEWPHPPDNAVAPMAFPLLFPVEIYAAYGGGFWWRGWATRLEVDPDYCIPYGAEGQWGEEITPRQEMFDSFPEWVVAHNLDPYRAHSPGA